VIPESSTAKVAASAVFAAYVLNASALIFTKGGMPMIN